MALTLRTIQNSELLKVIKVFYAIIIYRVPLDKAAERIANLMRDEAATDKYRSSTSSHKRAGRGQKLISIKFCSIFSRHG